MRKIFTSAPILSFLVLSLSGCSAVGDKKGSLSIIYWVVAILSALLLLGCICVVRKRRVWFISLFTSVFVVNVGYTFLSVAPNLKTALWANRISYFGSVFLPFIMLMIILNVTNTAYKKWLPNVLFGMGILVFLIAASPGILPIYYKEVSFEVVGGVSKLVKVYGPLHLIYLIYLLGYFFAMVAVIIRANIKKTIDTSAHAVVIAIAVFVNIGVWLIEQLVSIDFEMLSISYIISELFLFGLHLVMNENRRFKEIVKQVETVESYFPQETDSDVMLEKPIDSETVSPECIEIYMSGLETLTPTEKSIYEAYIARVTTKEIMVNLNIKESTLKYHNRNIYSKLGVSTRKELLEVHKQIKSLKAKLEGAKKNLD